MDNDIKEYNKANFLNLTSDLYNKALVNYLKDPNIEDKLSKDPDWANKMATYDVIFNLFFKSTHNFADDHLRNMIEEAIKNKRTDT